MEGGKFAMERWNAYTGDLGGMVDEVDGGIRVVAESDLLIDEYFVGEGAEDFDLLVLRSVGSGGVGGTAEGVVLCWAPIARLQG